MSKLTVHDYRLKIIDRGQATFFIRRNGETRYVGGDETPLALSNLLSSRAAEVRFKLEDATGGQDAAYELRAALKAIWANNLPQMPTVEVLS